MKATIVDISGHQQYVVDVDDIAQAEAQFGFERVATGLATSEHHRWNGAQWVLKSTSEIMPAARAAAWARIKAERERRLASTFTHAGNTYDIDPVNLSGASIDAREALLAGELLWSQMWVLANNTVTTLTATEMIAVGRACKTVVSNFWGTSQHLRGLIEAATTIAQVEAIAWP